MPKQGDDKVPITLRALLQRINRRLAERGQVLKKARGEAERAHAGDYYIVDTNRAILIETHVDPEALGRKLDTLRSWESVVGKGE
jgi:hypothetical protein